VSCFKATRTDLIHKLADAASYKNVPQETLTMFVGQKKCSSQYKSVIIKRIL